MERILIVRLGAMGDVIHGLPAAAALRRAFPAATIGWVVEPRWQELLCAAGTPRIGPRSPSRPLVDALHVLDTRALRKTPASPSTWKAARTELSEVRAARYEIALDLQGLMKSALVAKLSGARRRIGFAQPKERAAAVFYTRSLEARGTHVVERYLSLVATLTGGTLGSPPPAELPRDPESQTWCEGLLNIRGISGFALLNPGAGWGAKLWPAERYGEVARALAQAGLYSLVNAGPGEEELAQKVVTASRGTAQIVSPALGQLIALTRRARLFVGGDSGPLHLAAALGVPVVALFGPTDPARNGPFGTRSEVLRSAASRTSYAHVSRADQGLLAISSAEVIAASRRLLESPGA
ncbi:MAG TPA: glycosyltransferase family 9 protein [Terriglobales bacterium]|nr:glycosyltransferase family 9 protein [Terriglobales bacterium]